MRLRMTLFSVFLLVATVLSGAIVNRHARAADFFCKGNTCPNDSKCSGDHFTRTGCVYNCYVNQGTPGEVVWSGSANCAATPPGGGGGGGGGEGGGASCWTDWDCYAGESCDQGSGTCQEYGGGYGGLMP
jgi:hypothetical protein